MIQFHGIGRKTVTLNREIYQQSNITDYHTWVVICSQILECLVYLHCDAKVLHNDIKPDNILLTKQIAPSGKYHIVLTDFGKATSLTSGRLFESEKLQYSIKFPHVSPEVVNGESKQTTASDMYAIGVMFIKIQAIPSCIKEAYTTLATNCKKTEYHCRPSAANCLETIRSLMSQIEK